MKRTLLAVLAIFALWSVMDFIIHGLLLGEAYAGTPALWRPMDEMRTMLLYLTVLAAAAAFVVLYDRFIAQKGARSAVLFGLVYGAGMGVSMGYGSYSVMPIPHAMALTWFLGTLAEAVAGALVMDRILRR